MKYNYALIVYFTGTGGTQRIAEALEQEMKENGCDTSSFPLDYQINPSFVIDKKILQRTDLIFVLYPVHAFDAPRPVYEWIDQLPDGEKKRTIVLSVSGGGDVAPNKGSRVRCIRALEEKNYQVVYEKMLVMPSNFAFTASDDMNMWLLKSVPERAAEIAADVMADKVNRVETKERERSGETFFQRIQPPVEKFGLYLFATEACDSCEWCADHCPRMNIRMVKGKPEFSDQCIMCMRCVYGCHAHAIMSEKYGFAIVKEGFDLQALEEKMKDKKLKAIEDCEGGILWFGVKRYLLEE